MDNNTPKSPTSRHRQAQHYASNNREARLEGVTWRTTTAQELQLLQQVEETLKSQPWWPEQATAIPQPPPTRRWAGLATNTLAWAGAICVCLLVGAFSWRLFEHPQHKAGQALQQPKPFAPIHRRLQVPMHTHKQLAKSGYWQLKAQGGTRLEWRQSSPHRAVFKLTGGHIKVHVTPGSMKQFEVHWAEHTRLIVKGTRFTVEQRGNWLRLEVQRGVVQLHHKGQAPQLFSAGQGVRLLRSDHKTQPYSLSQIPAMDLKQQLAWLRTQTPALACASAMDWSERPTLSQLQRKDLLEHTAYILQPKGHNGCITRLWLRIHKLHISAACDETALAAAAQSCRRGKHKAQCVRLYRQYLRTYPKGMLREHVLYWLLRGLSQQSSRQHREAVRLLQEYKRTFPGGQYKRSLRELRQQMTLHKP